MRVLSLALSTVCLSLLLTSARAEDPRSRVYRESFKVKPGGNLMVDTDRGSISVEGRDVQEVQVEVRVKATRGSEARAAELLERHEVRLVQEGDTIRVEAELRGEKNWNWRGPNLEVSVQATVPREFNLEGTTAGGSVAAANLKGSVSVRTAGGSVRLENLTGAIQGRTAGGSIEGVRLDGEVKVNTAGGKITLEGVTGKQLHASTSGGGIRVAGVTVPAELKTSGGGIDVETSGAGLLASTSGGSVSAVFTGAPSAESVLKTSGGGVTAVLPADSRFDLDASTSAGSVRSEFPVSVTTSGGERSSLKGPVNGGGPILKLRSSAGSIHLKKGDGPKT